MVVIRGEVPLGVHAFEEEVVCLPRGKSGKRYGTALGCLFLLYGFGRIGICGNVVEYGHDGDFVGVPAHDGGGIRNRSSDDVAENRAFVIGRERFGEALCREEELCGEVDASFSGGVFAPVFNKRLFGVASTHEGAFRAFVLVWHAACVVAVRVCRTVMRMLRVLVACTHQKGNIPRVCAESVIHVVQSHFQVAFVLCEFVHQEDGNGGTQVVADNAPVKTRPDKVVWSNDLEVGGAFMRVACAYARVHENRRVALVRGIIQNLAECGHGSHRKRVAFDFAKSVFRSRFLALQNQVLECEKNVGVDVLVVRCPASGRKTAFVAEETCPEVVQVELIVRGVVEYLGVLVQVVTVCGILGGVPQGESCRSAVVIARASTGIETGERCCPS